MHLLDLFLVSYPGNLTSIDETFLSNLGQFIIARTPYINNYWIPNM